MKPIRRPDDVLRSNLAIMTLANILLSWIIGVFLMYDFVPGAEIDTLYYAALATPQEPLLWIGPIVGLVGGMFLFAFLVNRWKTGFSGASFLRRLRGAQMVNPTALAAKTKRPGKVPQLSVAGIPIPREVESKHFLIGGSTGTGKSLTFHEIFDGLEARRGAGGNARWICVDPDGGFMKTHFQPGDVILNPFDARSLGWSIFNEIRVDYDCDQYAIALIPRSASTEQEVWNSMARTIVAETLATLLRLGEATTGRLIYWLTKAPNEDLALLLANTPAAGCFHGAEDTLASIRTVLTRYITPHKYLPEGDFSFRTWLESGTNNLWITWREDMLQALRPLISCWVDVCSAAVLSLPDNDQRGLFGLFDELDSLEKLNFLPDAVTKGRKKGFTAVAGIQSRAQLDDRYGKNDAITLCNSFRSFALYGVGALDKYTAEEFSKAVGAHEVVRRRETRATGKLSVAEVRESPEPLVSPVEFHLLKDRHGYVKFSGDYPVSRIVVPGKPREEVIAGMVLSEALSESPQESNRLFDLRLDS